MASCKIRIRRGIVHLVTYAHGKRREESTGIRLTGQKGLDKEAMRLAERIRMQRELDLIAGFYGISMPGRKEVTLLDYAREFAEERPETQMDKALPYIEKFGGGEISVREVTESWFERFVEKMKKDSELSPSTQERYTCRVRQLLKKAVRDGLLRQDPSAGIKHIQVPESTKEFLTGDEVRKMASTEYHTQSKNLAFEDEVRRAFLFGCVTGFRISDIMSLEWKHVDREHRQIAKRQQKTKRFVYVPLNEEAEALMGDGKEGLVFPSVGERRYTASRYLRKWAEAAGIFKHVSWHTARHTDATLLIESGADLYTVQRLLGHSKIQTTMQYAVVSDKKKREAVDALPVLGLSGID